MLLKRFVTGSILAFGSMALVIWYPVGFFVEVGILSVLGLVEFFILIKRNNRINKSLLITAIVAAVIYTVSVYFFSFETLFCFLMFVALIMMIIHITRKNFYTLYNSSSPDNFRFYDVGNAIFGFIYTTCLLSFLLLILKTPGTFFVGGYEVGAGACFVIYLIFITAFCDMGAYFIGKYFGKNKLWPQISPKKTMEGAVAGLISSVVIAYLLGGFLGIAPLLSVFCGLTLSIAAQLGDLFESLLKREAGAKDSGNILAGHGGILDRFDSYFFTAPLMYIFIRMFILQ